MRIAWVSLMIAGLVYGESAGSFVVPVGELVATGSPAMVRPIVGIRGSLVVGSAVTGGNSGLVAPGGSWALAVQSGKLYVVRGGDGAKPVLLRSAAADVTAFSSGGSAVALLDKASATVEVWTGLPDAPALHATLSAAGSSAIARVEVSDDGEVCLGLSDAGDVFTLSAGNAPRRSAFGAQVRSVRFVPGTLDVLVVGLDGRVFRGSLAAGALQPVSSVDSAFQDVVLSADGGSALLIGDDSLVYLPLRGGEPVKASWTRGVPRVSSLRAGQFAVSVDGEPGVWLTGSDASLTYIAEI